MLGKTILFTDQSGWIDEQIVQSYRSQAHIEFAFRAMKDPHSLGFRPQYHSTDQKLRVHALFCVIGLTIATLLRRQLAQNGISVSLAQMFEQLSDVKEIALLDSDSKAKTKAKAAPSTRTRPILSDYDEEQARMIAALDLARFTTAADRRQESPSRTPLAQPEEPVGHTAFVPLTH